MLSDKPEKKEKKDLAQKSDYFIIFALNNKIFGIDVLKTREVIRRNKSEEEITDSFNFIKSIIQFRDKKIPLVDLNHKLKMKQIEPRKKNKVIVIDVDEQLIGLEVNKVLDIVSIKKSSIKTIPDNETKKIPKKFIKGIVDSNNYSELIMDILITDINSFIMFLSVS
ncbi:MAG: chemotaxis protein CheW [Bacillota bacterium]